MPHFIFGIFFSSEFFRISEFGFPALPACVHLWLVFIPPQPLHENLLPTVNKSCLLSLLKNPVVRPLPVMLAGDEMAAIYHAKEIGSQMP